jgi:hypothetical protein
MCRIGELVVEPRLALEHADGSGLDIGETLLRYLKASHSHERNELCNKRVFVMVVVSMVARVDGEPVPGQKRPACPRFMLV